MTSHTVAIYFGMYIVCVYADHVARDSIWATSLYILYMYTTDYNIFCLNSIIIVQVLTLGICLPPPKNIDNYTVWERKGNKFGWSFKFLTEGNETSVMEWDLCCRFGMYFALECAQCNSQFNLSNAQSHSDPATQSLLPACPTPIELITEYKSMITWQGSLSLLFYHPSLDQPPSTHSAMDLLELA